MLGHVAQRGAQPRRTTHSRSPDHRSWRSVTPRAPTRRPSSRSRRLAGPRPQSIGSGDLSACRHQCSAAPQETAAARRQTAAPASPFRSAPRPPSSADSSGPPLAGAPSPPATAGPAQNSQAGTQRPTLVHSQSHQRPRHLLQDVVAPVRPVEASNRGPQQGIAEVRGHQHIRVEDHAEHLSSPLTTGRYRSPAPWPVVPAAAPRSPAAGDPDTRAPPPASAAAARPRA